jgi:DNA polymerase-3 subunit beta
MNIECIKEKLWTALAKAERMTGKNITLPILNCVLLEAKDNSVSIKATNLDVGIEIVIPAKVNKPGNVAILGNVLYNFVSNTQDKNIILEAKDSTLYVKTKHTESIIKTFPIDDFPRIPKVNIETPFTFNVQSLIKGLKTVSYAASVSSLRPVLNTVRLSSDEDMVTFVATDSFRLAEKKIGVKKHKEFNEILIPLKNIGDIIHSIEDIDGDIEVLLNENQIAFRNTDLYMTSRVIDGAFPDYKQIIPKESKTEVILLKQDLISALKMSNIFSDKFNQVTFTISPETKKFTITTKNSDIGENIQSLDAVIKGDELTISFNYKYIVDSFQSIDSDSISLSFSESSRPVIIRGISDKSFMYLIMSMNK